FSNAEGDSFPEAAFAIKINISPAAAVAPVITTQPQGATVTVGGSATFAAAASGSPAPAYQWKKDGSGLPGATNATLTLGNVQLADAGSYAVDATNSAGTATSTSAVLTV